MNEKRRIVVIGAGASGLAAACAAAGSGAEVTLVEKNHVPGRKILATGSGKCNLSNKNMTAAHYHGGEPVFAASALKALPPENVLDFFEDLGLLLNTVPDGRIFPRSMKASDVVNVLVNRLREKNADIMLLTSAQSVKKNLSGFEITVRRVPPQWDKKAAPGRHKTLAADAVILAAGGPAYPQIGGSVLGLDLARSLGHTVKAPLPVITPLMIKEKPVKTLDGIRVEAGITVYSDGKPIGGGQGELLFTNYGVSGPAVLTLSRAVVAALETSKVAFHIDLFPDYSLEQLLSLLRKRRDACPDRTWKNFLCGLAEERIVNLLSAALKIDASLPAGAVKDPLLAGFAGLLKDWSLEAAGSLGFENAMAAAGGVFTTEINPETFESKLVQKLFITGELLDIDGDCGGYNLHFAWTSGLLAGRHAASK